MKSIKHKYKHIRQARVGSHLGDCKRLVCLAKDRGYLIDINTAAFLWEDFSNSMDCGWIMIDLYNDTKLGAKIVELISTNMRGEAVE